MALDSNDEYLTVPEVAREMRYSERTVRNWINEGRLPAIQPNGREYRVARKHLDALKTRVGAAAQPAPAESTPLESETSLLAQLRLPDDER